MVDNKGNMEAASNSIVFSTNGFLSEISLLRVCSRATSIPHTISKNFKRIYGFEFVAIQFYNCMINVGMKKGEECAD